MFQLLISVKKAVSVYFHPSNKKSYNTNSYLGLAHISQAQGERRGQKVFSDASKNVARRSAVQGRHGGIAVDDGGRLPDLPVDPLSREDHRSPTGGRALPETR